LCLAVASLVALARFLETERRGAALAYLGLLAAALLVFEDPVTTPLVGLALTWALGRSPRATWPVHLTALLLAGGVVLSTLAGGSPRTYGLAPGLGALGKAAALPRELAVSLLLPHADLAATWVRLLVGAALLAGVVGATWPFRRELARVSRPLFFGVAWMGLAALPFALRPTGSVWHSRYLYTMGAGLALVLATLVHGIWPALSAWRRRLLAVMGLGLLLVNAANMEYMIRKIQGEWDGVVTSERYDAAFELARRLNREPPPPGSELAVTGSPLSSGELASVCRRFVLGAPRCVRPVR
jgi:hypothetical protein